MKKLLLTIAIGVLAASCTTAQTTAAPAAAAPAPAPAASATPAATPAAPPAGAPRQQQPPQPWPAAATMCGAEGDFKFICGMRGPEDVLRIPGTDWVVSSWIRGGLTAVNIRDLRVAPIYTIFDGAEKLDAATYGKACPGAPSAEQRARFGSVGVAVRTGANGVHTLYTVNISRRVVEVVELDLRGPAPKGAWIGCVAPPADIGLNSVAPTPEGGFLMSSWQPPGPDQQDIRRRMEAGEINGAVYEWAPAKGWAKLPGTETSGANGVEISRDGRTVYFAGWGNRTFNRITRGAGAPKRDTVQLDFRMDNMHWAPDGTLLAAGHRDSGRTDSRIVKIDPATLKVTQLLQRDDNDTFMHSTGATQVGEEIWVGSNSGERLLVFTPKK